MEDHRPISSDRSMDWEAYRRDALSAVAAASAAGSSTTRGFTPSARRAGARVARGARRGGDAAERRPTADRGSRRRPSRRAGNRRARTTPGGRDRRHASGRGVARRSPAPDHPDAPPDRGSVPRPWVPRSRRPRVETTEYNFDKLAFDPWHPARSHRATFFLDDRTVLRTETSPSQIHSWRNARSRRSTWSRSAAATGARRDRRDALSDLPPVRGTGRRRGPHARRP